MTETITEPTLNVPLLRKVVEWAEGEAQKAEHESEWHQGTWRVRAEIRSRMYETPCGTAYCIAGKVAQLEGAQWTSDSGVQVIDQNGNDTTVPELSRNALGLTPSQASRLFFGSNTIEDVRARAETIAGERL